MATHTAPTYYRHGKQIFGPQGPMADATDELSADVIVLSLNIAKKAGEIVRQKRRIYGDGQGLPALAENMPRDT